MVPDKYSLCTAHSYICVIDPSLAEYLGSFRLNTGGGLISK